MEKKEKEDIIEEGIAEEDLEDIEEEEDVVIFHKTLIQLKRRENMKDSGIIRTLQELVTNIKSNLEVENNLEVDSILEVEVEIIKIKSQEIKFLPVLGIPWAPVIL